MGNGSESDGLAPRSLTEGVFRSRGLTYAIQIVTDLWPDGINSNRVCQQHTSHLLQIDNAICHTPRDADSKHTPIALRQARLTV